MVPLLHIITVLNYTLITMWTILLSISESYKYIRFYRKVCFYDCKTIPLNKDKLDGYILNKSGIVLLFSLVILSDIISNLFPRLVMVNLKC